MIWLIVFRCLTDFAQAIFKTRNGESGNGSGTGMGTGMGTKVGTEVGTGMAIKERYLKDE